MFGTKDTKENTKNQGDDQSSSRTKALFGVVVSDVMDKTVVVKVDRFIKHPKYKKFYTTSKKFKAHDPENTYKTGDKVEIMPCKPISKDKTFKVIGLVASQ